MATETGPLPNWARRALAIPGESRTVDVDGTAIHYLGWNLDHRDKPGLLLVHGFNAHAHWWDFIAPFLAQHYRVAAMDFGGMGDSGHREQYRSAVFAREIAAVIDDAGLAPALLVAHSFGGLMAIRCCHEYPESINAAVILDSRTSFPDDHSNDDAPVERPRRVYPSQSAALSRFRLIPPENSAPAFVLDHVGRHSLKRDGDQWVWKFDHRILAGEWPQIDNTISDAERLTQIDRPVALVYGELSKVMPPDIAERAAGYLRHPRPPICVEGAYHHVLLDKPQALTALLLRLLPDLMGST